MKGLLKILGIAAVVFIAIAMVQQWQVFASAWFGYVPEIPTLSDQDREETEKSLRHYLTLTGHLYRSNGDTRFLERMPASQRVTEELMADIVYLRHNGRYQEPTMQGFEIVDVQLAAPGKVEVFTREHWVIRTRSLSDGVETDPVLSEVGQVRYRMSKEAAGWIIHGWEMITPAENSTQEAMP